MVKYKIKQLDLLKKEVFVESTYPDVAIKDLLDGKLSFEVENTKNGNKWMFCFSRGRIYRKE